MTNLNRRNFLSSALSAAVPAAQQAQAADGRGKQARRLREGWKIQQLQGHGKLSAAQVRELAAESSTSHHDWLATVAPAQVQEILLAHKRIEDPRMPGGPERCKWVAEQDWVYRMHFSAPQTSGRAYLHCLGLDTLVDVYLNGEHVAYHEDIYLPLRVDVTSLLRGDNVLLLHFHSPYAYLSTAALPAKLEGKVAKQRLLRKCNHDFGNYLGAHPYFTPIGIFGDVCLETVDECEISDFDVRYGLSEDYKKVNLRIQVQAEGEPQAVPEITLSITDPDGKTAAQRTVPMKPAGARLWSADAEIAIDAPRLWFPLGYGDQPLYEITAVLASQGRVRDQASRRTGFRDLKMRKPFDFAVNGQAVKLWGANLTPLDMLSHRWDSLRLARILTMVENAHMTSIRAWGPGGPYDDELFAEADKRGILVWAEFFHDWGGYPDSPEFRNLCKREAEHYVRRSKHHPSILLWCGGNENFMGMEVSHPGSPVYGREIWEQDYPEICRRLDPDRYYHPNSPIGGPYANDPLRGDSHSYTHQWYVPGEQYPVFFTEDCRVSTPLAKSLKRLVGEKDFWPEGFTGVIRKPGESPLPPSWLQLTLGLDYFADRRGPFEEFYETGGTPEGLIYRLGSSHGLFIRRTVERLRRGRPATDPSGTRRSMGHYWWKLNSSWPMVFCDVIDYLLEPNIAYYALRRSYEPRLLSFEIGDHVYVWAVNDSGARMEGTLRFEMRDPTGVKILREMTRPVSIAPGESAVVMNLDELGMIWRRNILYAALVDRDGRIIARSNDFAQMECRLEFPEAKLSLSEQNGMLTVRTDQFARSVELAGDDGGGAFGWVFEDNFFDLLPGEVKQVRMLGTHRAGTVTAKAQFSPHSTRIEVGK